MLVISAGALAAFAEIGYNFLRLFSGVYSTSNFPSAVYMRDVRFFGLNIFR